MILVPQVIGTSLEDGVRAVELLQHHHSREFMRQGARGIVYGRNIIQHPKPKQMTRALMAIVHRDATPEEAAAILEQGNDRE